MALAAFPGTEGGIDWQQVQRSMLTAEVNFAVVILAGVFACAITSTGIFLVSRYEEWVKDRAPYFMSFAAGVLLTVSFLHILPRSFQMSEKAPVLLLSGLIGFYLINRLINLHSINQKNDNRGGSRYRSLIPIVGIGFHSFIDGVVYSITFKVSLFTGWLTALGTILHEFPEGIITFVLFKKGGFNRKKSIIYAFLAAGLTTPLGVLVSYPFLRQIEEPFLGSLLALSAGVLIYVGATHLLPEVEKENKPFTALTLLAGVATGVLIILSKG